jgi:hypothetical protein
VRYIYQHPTTGPRKPLNIGMNRAKRVARAADRRDTRAVQKEFGPGFPRQIAHHQELVMRRHRYYREAS